MPERAPAALLDAEVLDIDGGPVRLAREWEGPAPAPVVLVLLRHFGCIFCREQAAGMLEIGAAVRALGGRIVFVGSGSPQYARWFAEDFEVEWPVYSDAALVTYCALEARRGVLSSLNPRTFWLSLRAFMRGFRQTRTMGDRFQQGAVAVLLPDGRMAYRYVSRVAGDHPAPAEVLDALRAAVGAAPGPR